MFMKSRHELSRHIISSNFWMEQFQVSHLSLNSAFQTSS